MPGKISDVGLLPKMVRAHVILTFGENITSLRVSNAKSGGILLWTESRHVHFRGRSKSNCGSQELPGEKMQGFPIQNCVFC